jgi:hypothetical protein
MPPTWSLTAALAPTERRAKIVEDRWREARRVSRLARNGHCDGPSWENKGNGLVHSIRHSLERLTLEEIASRCPEGPQIYRGVPRGDPDRRPDGGRSAAECLSRGPNWRFAEDAAFYGHCVARDLKWLEKHGGIRSAKEMPWTYRGNETSDNMTPRRPSPHWRPSLLETTGADTPASRLDAIDAGGDRSGDVHRCRRALNEAVSAAEGRLAAYQARNRARAAEELGAARALDFAEFPDALRVDPDTDGDHCWDAFAAYDFATEALSGRARPRAGGAPEATGADAALLGGSGPSSPGRLPSAVALPDGHATTPELTQTQQRVTRELADLGNEFRDLEARLRRGTEQRRRAFDLAHGGGSPGGGYTNPPGTPRAIEFDDADTNGDGVLSREEYERAVGLVRRGQRC